MRFQHGMSMALYAGMLLADISDEMIERALEWRRDGHEIKRGGPLDARLGRVMRASGFLGATRYYVPDIKTASQITLENREIKWEREYIKDQAIATGEGKSQPPPDEGNAARYKERYYQTMIYMFPSVGGSVDIGRGEGDSLVRFLNSQDEGSEGKKSPKILAALMAMGLGAKLDAGDAKTGKPAKTKKSGEMNDIRIKHGEVVDVSVNLRKFPSVRNIVRFLEAGVEYEFSSLDKEFLLKESLLHGFIHYYFREYEELESFIDAFYEIVKGDEKMLKACFTKESDAENRDSEAFAALYKAVTDPKSLGIVQTIPFTPAAPQIRDEGAYFYNRRGAGGRGEFYPDDEFGDCVEAALLSSLYCLFFDPSQQRCRIKESCRELMGTELAMLIENYPEPYNMEQTTKERWWRIVEDLDDDRIVYCKYRTDKEDSRYRGELCTGLINFLRVVVKISGLNVSEYLSGFAEYRKRPREDDRKRIIEEFKEQFEKVVSRLCDKEVAISYPYGLKMEKVGRSDDDLGWDITGSVEFNMKDDMGRNGQFTLVQQTFHAKLDIKNTSVSIPEKKLGELYNHANELAENPRSQLDIYLKGAFYYFVASIPQLTERFIDVYRGLIKSCDYLTLLTITPLQNDEQKIALLKELFPYVVGGGNIRMEWLAENILNSLALDANVISRGVHPLVAFNMRLREDYAAILERHAVAPGDASGEQRSWLSSDEVRRQCIMSFYDKPELLMYLDEVDIVDTIMNYGDNTELCGAVQEIPDAGVRDKINACGFLVACKYKKTQLAQYFFEELEIMDGTICGAQLPYHDHYGKLPDLQTVADFFVELAETASDETIRKMYSWCFSSKGEQCIRSNIFPFVRMTYRKVGGIDFVVDQIMGVKDFDPIYGHFYARFYRHLLEWMQAEDIELRQDVCDIIKDYIELMEHESQDEDGDYFFHLPPHKIVEFRLELTELRRLFKSVTGNKDTDNTGTEPSDTASPTFETRRNTQ